MNDGRNMKFVTDSLEGATALIAERLGAASSNIDLSSAGLVLAGAGACHVPGGGKSVHLLYRDAEHILADEYPAIPLWCPVGRTLVRPYVQGMRPSRLGWIVPLERMRLLPR